MTIMIAGKLPDSPCFALGLRGWPKRRTRAEVQQLVAEFVSSGMLHPAFFWGGASVIGMDVATYVAKIML
jgi:hypothetical protein